VDSRIHAENELETAHITSYIWDICLTLYWFYVSNITRVLSK